MYEYPKPAGFRWKIMISFCQFFYGFVLFQICQGSIVRPRSNLFQLSIIHFNDFHARFDEIGPKSGVCHVKNNESCIGGIARIFTESHKLMKERPNAIFLNAGDHYQGTLWYNVHHWNVTATFLNMLPHDAMTIGNHEFDNKIDGLTPFLKMVNTPVVVTNIDASEEPSFKNLCRNSTVIVRNGTKIGVIGVIWSKTNTIANTEKLKFLDEVTTINAEAKKLKSQGVNIIIVLSHCGLEVDRIIGARCPLVDVVVGGHSHTFLYSGKPPYIDVPEDKYPVVVHQQEGNRTVLIVQAQAFTRYLGNLTVWFDKEGEVKNWDGNPILMDRSIRQATIVYFQELIFGGSRASENEISADPGVMKALVPWREAVNIMALTKIAKNKVLLDNDCRRGECNLANLITDSMVEAYLNEAENERFWSYAAVACTNVGGIRAPIEETAHFITYDDAVMVQPFENTWDTVELEGKCILEVLEKGVRTTKISGIWHAKGELLMWSGLKVVYNLTNPSGHRVVNVKIRCRECEVPKYENLIDDQWYRIVVPSYLMGGGNDYTMFKSAGRNHRVGTLDLDHFTKYLRKMSPITVGIEGRMTFLGTWGG